MMMMVVVVVVVVVVVILLLAGLSSCQLLLSKLLFISCLNVEIYVVTLIIEIPQKNLPPINRRL